MVYSYYIFPILMVLFLGAALAGLTGCGKKDITPDDVPSSVIFDR